MMNEAQRQDQSKPSGTNRRSFLNWLWIGLGLAALVEFAGLVNAFLTSRKLKADGEASDAVVVAGQIDNFKPNTVTAFPRGQFYLACLQDGGFLAISRRCTHLGCTVPWVADQMQFVCPCHSSVFDIHGDVVEAPAPRALDLFRVTIENRVVTVHTGQKIKRTGFKTDQVVFPRS